VIKSILAMSFLIIMKNIIKNILIQDYNIWTLKRKCALYTFFSLVIFRKTILQAIVQNYVSLVFQLLKKQ